MKIIFNKRYIRYLIKCITLVLHCVFSPFLYSLTETIDGLQNYMEDLQTQVDELKTAQKERNKRELAEQRRSLGAQSVSCLKELYDLHHDRYCMCVCVIAHTLLYTANFKITRWVR